MRRSIGLNFFRRNRQEDIGDEISFYLEMRAAEFMQSGMNEEEAREAAIQAFGDLGHIRDELLKIQKRPDRRRLKFTMGTILQDLKFSIRSLIRNRGFTALVVMTLGLGIGSTTAIFSVVNAVLLEPLPFSDEDRLVQLNGAFMAEDGPRIRGSSYPESQDWFTQSNTLSGLAAFGGGSVVLTSSTAAAERISLSTVDVSFFNLLGIDPVIGRTFLPEEGETVGTHPVVLISEDIWERRYARDRNLIGQSIQLNDVSHTVVGVIPAFFNGFDGGEVELWIPMMMLETTLGAPERLSDRGSRWLGAVGKLREGVTFEEAQADLDAVTADLERQFPRINEDRGVVVQHMRESLIGDTGSLTLIIMSAVACLLLIACVNVINLVLARAFIREGELSMRMAIGAGRNRIIQQFVIEGLMMASLGTAVGVFAAFAGTRGLTALLPAGVLPTFMNVELDAIVLLFTILIMAATAVLIGIVPAIHAIRQADTSGLRGDGSRGYSPSKVRLQHLLVVGELALALPLLVGAGLMARTLNEQLSIDTGVDVEQIAAFRIQLPADRYPTEVLPSFTETMRQQLAAVPGVEMATMGSDLPLRRSSSASFIFLEGKTASEDRIRYYMHRIAPEYFETLGIRLLEGRTLTLADVTDDDEVGGNIVIGEALSVRFFPGESAIGKRIHVAGPNGPLSTVVGVVQDPVYRVLTADLQAGDDDPDVYIPLSSLPSRFLDVALRTSGGDPAQVIPDARRALEAIDPNIPVYEAGPLSDQLRALTAQARFGSFLLNVFSLAALILSCVGIYGVMAFMVGLRRREIAIRLAIGASSDSVRGLVVGRGLRLALVGLVLGIGISLGVSRFLADYLYVVTARDPMIFTQVGLIAIVAMLIASYFPARKATRIQPQSALQDS